LAVSLQATDVCSYTSIARVDGRLTRGGAALCHFRDLSLKLTGLVGASLLGSIGFGGCGSDGCGFGFGGFVSGYGFIFGFLGGGFGGTWLSCSSRLGGFGFGFLGGGGFEGFGVFFLGYLVSGSLVGGSFGSLSCVAV